MESKYLESTKMLDYHSPEIKKLIEEKGWNHLDDYHKIKAVYDYVQNEILFGYNASDMLSATEVLKAGFGQCNTKATLLMALLRAIYIPCRLHGFDVFKDFQSGVIPKVAYRFVPEHIVHTWVEVDYEHTWIALEGVITDQTYLTSVQDKHTSATGEFKNYAIATKNIKDPKIEWQGKDTFIQKEAVVHDYGIYPSPDEFFRIHRQYLSKVKNFIYAHFISKMMTKKVQKIRASKK